jgi:hypothetical protein
MAKLAREHECAEALIWQLAQQASSHVPKKSSGVLTQR